MATKSKKPTGKAPAKKSVKPSEKVEQQSTEKVERRRPRPPGVGGGIEPDQPPAKSPSTRSKSRKPIPSDDGAASIVSSVDEPLRESIDLTMGVDAESISEQVVAPAQSSSVPPPPAPSTNARQAKTPWQIPVPESSEAAVIPRTETASAQNTVMEQTAHTEGAQTEGAQTEVSVLQDSLLTDQDIYLFNEGRHSRLYDRLGAHRIERGKTKGTTFAVWAPNAARVSVVGDFNGWGHDANPLQLRANSGIWEGFVPGIGQGAVYKYHIVSQHGGYVVDKADPFAFRSEVAPRTASIVWDLDYEWGDQAWMKSRAARNALSAPYSIYEMHLGSWRRDPADPSRFLSYRELAAPLAQYMNEMGFTHVELLPVMEHPFYGSWGYQVTGFFSASSRFGSPQDLMYLVDYLHQHDIGVILDWVPSHFPSDEHSLSYFDGTHLYEHADPRKGLHPDWGSLIFNYGRNEVRSFLLSSALFWIERFHADGLRVDAVASMLYLDYSRKAGQWIPNEHGGRENLEAIEFLRGLNEDVYKAHPDVQVIAEESTAWPMVSRPTYVGGLGFGMKWDMGWMHDTLRYFSHEAIHRKFHHNSLTFRAMYAYSENFILPLSHDEVVYGKGSLLGKMPGDEWRRFANLRLLFAHQYSQPGKKLIFMGGEFGQWREWNHDAGLDWELTQTAPHGGLQHWVADLNAAYRRYPALHELDVDPSGFEWIDCCDTEQSVISLVRRAASDDEPQVVIVLNFTPVVRFNYQIGLPTGGYWREVLNSDAPVYGGSGQGNLGGVEAVPIPLHGRKYSANLTLPPLGAIFLINDTVTEPANVVMLPLNEEDDTPEELTA
jgi:1,4-alpha-glucan branching enzyme